MGWTDILAIIGGLILPILTALLTLFNLRFHRAKSRQDEYRFTREFLSNVSGNPYCHRLLWERGFYALSGIPDVPTGLARMLMNAPGPVWTAIRRYRYGGRWFLEYDASLETLHWNAWWRSKWTRSILINITCSVWYVAGIALGMFSFQLLFDAPELPPWPQITFIAVFILSMFFGTPFLSLLLVIGLDDAEKLLQQLNREPKRPWLIVRVSGRIRSWFARPRIAE